MTVFNQILGLFQLILNSSNSNMSASNDIRIADDIKSDILAKSNEILSNMGLSGDALSWVRMISLAIVIALVSWILWWVTRKILLTIVHTVAAKSKTTWDDHLMDEKFFAALAHLVPLIFMDWFIGIAFAEFSGLETFLQRSTTIVIIYVFMIAAIRFLKANQKVLKEQPRFSDKPIESYFQLGRILVNLFFIIVMISVGTGVDLVLIFTSLGAMTAVLILVFKDTILGFVGSLQLASNDMVRVGDWITMSKYEADGDVIEINLNTVKVQNFDKTITTIPTYSFISDSFKNWRGMTESQGRRIRRSVNLKIDSVKFCTEEMLERFKSYDLIKDYIDSKQSDILEYNKQNDIAVTGTINGRSQTNLGIFRTYLEAYLKTNRNVNQEMTLMVRQLAPTEMGVPLEIYCFTKTKEWGDYEIILADMFDHVLSCVKAFDLETFERPSGSDFAYNQKAK